MLSAGAMLPWSGGAFRYVGETRGMGGPHAHVAPLAPPRAVIDAAGMFDAAATERLGAAVEEARDRTGNDFVVVTTRGLKGERYQSFASRYHAGWSGAEVPDTTVIIFLSPRDGLVGLSNGDDLPRPITEEERQAIIERMIVFARAGDLEGAALSGVEGAADLLGKTSSPGAEAESLS